MFPCKECDRTYAQRAGLSRHRAEAHRAPRASCEECGRAFGNAALLRVHQRKAHAHRPCGVCGARVALWRWELHASLHVHPRERIDLGLNCARCCRLFDARSIAAHERDCRERAPETLPDAPAQREAAFARYDVLLADATTSWAERLRAFRATECQRVTDEALWCGLCNAVHWGRPPIQPPGAAPRSQCSICGKGFAHMQSLSRHRRRAHGGARTPPPQPPTAPVNTTLPTAVDPEALRRVLHGFAMLR